MHFDVASSGTCSSYHIFFHKLEFKLKDRMWQKTQWNHRLARMNFSDFPQFHRFRKYLCAIEQKKCLEIIVLKFERKHKRSIFTQWSFSSLTGFILLIKSAKPFFFSAGCSAIFGYSVGRVLPLISLYCSIKRSTYLK